MKNKLMDLNNHLFAELERLGDESTTGEELMEELSRAKAITDVAEQVICNAALMLKAEMARGEFMNAKEFTLPKMLDSDA